MEPLDWLWLAGGGGATALLFAGLTYWIVQEIRARPAHSEPPSPPNPRPPNDSPDAPDSAAPAG